MNLFCALLRNGVPKFRGLGILVLAFVPLLTFPISLVIAQPSKGYDVISYDATVKLDRTTDSLWGVVSMTARATDTCSAILQHAKYLTIDSVIASNSGSRVPIQWLDTASGAYNVIPVSGFVAGQTFRVTTFYHGKGRPEQNAYKWGGVTDEDSMMFAMGVGFAVPYTSCTRHWLPSYDLPDDKADSVDLTFICRDGDIIASNGLLVSDFVNSGWRTMHWHISHPIATYLLMFATGPYTFQNISNSLNKPFEVFALKRDSANSTKEMGGRVANILAFYDSLYGHYPIEKVGYVLTPIGSMEHQGMICLDTIILQAPALADTSTIDNSTIAVHELSHMWWGDWVTCKTFDDAWLNEGFARFSESLSLEHLFGRSQYLVRQHSNIAGAKSSSLPLSGAPTVDKHSNNYPYSTIYQKGAAVLGMLRQYLGDSLFFASVRYYGNAHAYSTATSADLQSAFEHVTGQDLNWFFREWVYNIGYPRDTISWSRTSNGASIVFKQARYNPQASYFRIPVPVLGATQNGKSKLVTVWMDSLQSTTTTAYFGFTPDTIVIDPDGLLLMRVVKQTLAIPETQGELLPNVRMEVYPNPDRTKILQIVLDGNRPFDAIRLSLFDATGRLIRALDTSSAGTSIRLTLDTSGLSAGDYTLVAEAEHGERIMQKITLNP